MGAEPVPRAILLGVRLPELDARAFEASLSELERLVQTLGYAVTARVTQARTQLAPGTVVGEGKLHELAALTGGSGSVAPSPRRSRPVARGAASAERAAASNERGETTLDDEDDAPSNAALVAAELDPNASEEPVALVAVDHELTPTELRNLERATGVPVLDRPGVIIEIFHRHAHTRQAKLEVEIARLTYLAPRLRASPRGKERQQGRGSGEAGLELDRRRIRDRIAELRRELESIGREQALRRVERRSARRVALVGYTNAGKSSLMRALTGSNVLVQDQLFATLDTTVRALKPEAQPRVLVSDTVGFIRKLPHDLVASFKSTLDEALEASLLLHLVDGSDPDWRAELGVTRTVLEEIGASSLPRRLVVTKVDRLAPDVLAELEHELPDAWFVCTRDPEHVARVRDGILAFFDESAVEEQLLVPYDRQRLISELYASGRVLEQRYEPEGVVVRMRADSQTLERFRSALAE